MSASAPPRAAARVYCVMEDQLVAHYGLERGKYPDTASATAFLAEQDALPGDILIAEGWDDVFREPAYNYYAWDGHRAHVWDKFGDRIVPDRFPVRYWARGRLAGTLHEALIDVRGRRDELLANLRFGLPAGARGYVYCPPCTYGTEVAPGLPGVYNEHGRCLELHAGPGELIRGARGIGRPRGFVHTTFFHGGAAYCLVLEEHGTAYGPPDEDAAALVEAFRAILAREDSLEVSVSGDRSRFGYEPEIKGRFLPRWGRAAPTPLYYQLPSEAYPPNLDLAGAVPWGVKSWLRWDELGYEDPAGPGPGADLWELAARDAAAAWPWPEAGL